MTLRVSPGFRERPTEDCTFLSVSEGWRDKIEAKFSNQSCSSRYNIVWFGQLHYNPEVISVGFVYKTNANYWNVMDSITGLDYKDRKLQDLVYFILSSRTLRKWQFLWMLPGMEKRLSVFHDVYAMKGHIFLITWVPICTPKNLAHYEKLANTVMRLDIKVAKTQ